MAVLTKMDIAEAVEFDRGLACCNIRPGLPIVETSARKEDGLEAWLVQCQTSD